MMQDSARPCAAEHPSLLRVNEALKYRNYKDVDAALVPQVLPGPKNAGLAFKEAKFEMLS